MGPSRFRKGLHVSLFQQSEKAPCTNVYLINVNGHHRSFLVVKIPTENPSSGMAFFALYWEEFETYIPFCRASVQRSIYGLKPEISILLHTMSTVQLTISSSISQVKCYLANVEKGFENIASKKLLRFSFSKINLTFISVVSNTRVLFQCFSWNSWTISVFRLINAILFPTHFSEMVGMFHTSFVLSHQFEQKVCFKTNAVKTTKWSKTANVFLCRSSSIRSDYSVTTLTALSFVFYRKPT